MADIEIIYVSDAYCEYGQRCYCTQCHTMAAEDLGCKLYIPDGETFDEKTGCKVIPFGDCARAKINYVRKGWSGKRYEVNSPIEDPYNPHLNSCEVTLGNTTYYSCVKVILNGKVIYNNYDEETEE